MSVKTFGSPKKAIEMFRDPRCKCGRQLQELRFVPPGHIYESEKSKVLGRFCLVCDLGPDPEAWQLQIKGAPLGPIIEEPEGGNAA